MQVRKSINRREFLKLAALSSVGSAVLAACGAPQAPAAPTAATQPTSKPAEEPTAKPAPAETVEVRWQCETGVQYSKMADEAVALFQDAHPNIRIAPEPRVEGWFEKTLAGMAAGTAPDILNAWGFRFWQWAAKGQLVNHNDYVKDMPAEDIADFAEWQWKGFVIPTTNFRYGIPNQINMMVLYYNKGAFQEATVDYPTVDWNHDNYAAAVRQLTKKDSAGKTTRWGGYIPAWRFDRFQAHVLMYGGHVVDPNDLTKTWLDRPEAQQGLEWIRKLMWDDNALIQPLQAQNQEAMSTFPTQLIATAEDGVDIVGVLADQSPFEWDIAHVPQGPARRAVLGATDGWALWSGSKHLPEAWEMVKFLVSPEYLKRQSRAVAFVPPRKSLLPDWVQAVRASWPKLEKVNLQVIVDALTTMGYPTVDESFLCQADVNEVLTPALEKLFITGGTAVSYLKDIKGQIEQAAASCNAKYG